MFVRQLASWPLRKGRIFGFGSRNLCSDSTETISKEDREEDVKNKVLDASLPFVPEFGWNDRAVKAGVESMGYPNVASGLIEDPGIELIHHHVVMSNSKLETLMLKDADEERRSNDGGTLKIDPFIRRHVETRLRMNSPYFQRWPEALAIMTCKSPIQSFIYGLELMDVIWHCVGDTSYDYQWYTKRISLGLIYKATELAMLTDESPDFEETWKFLDRRLNDQRGLTDVIKDIQDVPHTLSGVAITARNILGLR